MALTASVYQCGVVTIFNEVKIKVNPGVDFRTIVSGYLTESNRRNLVWQKSSTGKRAAREAVVSQKKAEAALAEGIKSFSLKDPKGWQLALEKNQDGYGSCVMRYVARWANLMEQKIVSGSKLEDIAEVTSYEANAEGITGFMYGCAVSLLSQVWEHGEELRRWHNLKTQIGKEGEKANENGGVLNPALLNIG